MLIAEAIAQTDSDSYLGTENGPRSLSELDPDDQSQGSILFKNDRIYRHNLARINYTSYDVRRSQDVINPTTPHRDIMLLASARNPNQADTSLNHPFLYARVLGIFHTNAIYVGKSMQDYSSRRIEFLWVRWLQIVDGTSSDWGSLKLDLVSFPPIAAEAAFGFVDPADVLRGSHVIPAFSKGKVRIRDGGGLSRCAHDDDDWRRYYINRYVCL